MEEILIKLGCTNITVSGYRATFTFMGGEYNVITPTFEEEFLKQLLIGAVTNAFKVEMEKRLYECK